MQQKSDRIGVIGGGLGGLAAACTLASRGHRVTLFEKNTWLGGKAAVLEADGFRFDMGPTILTLPSVLARIFGEAGKRLEEQLDLVRLNPQWRSFFADGSVLDLHSNRDAMRRELGAFSTQAGLGESYERFLEFSERLHGISDRFFFWRSVGSVLDTMDLKGTFSISMLRELLAMRPGRSVYQAVRHHVKEPRLAQMLDHFTQYVGSSPLNSPAVLCGIAHMQTKDGVWYPRGGTGAIPTALSELAGQLGVEVRLECDIARICVAEGRVYGVETTAGERVELDAVVSNSDVVRTHTDLLGGRFARSFRPRRWEPACSGVVLYLGLRERYAHLAHHNFVFSKDPETEFEDIYGRGEPTADPTCYVCAPAVSEPAVAPPGGEALYVLVHTPYLRPHHDWSQLFPDYRRVILDKLARTAGLEDLEERTVYQSALTPQDIHERYRVLNGAIYGVASHGKFLGAFKPANRDPRIRGLYHAGGSAHPGPGMPMVLMSGWIAADCLHQDRAGAPVAAAPGVSRS